ncbi:MAG TPA: purine-nucleoside phosphorylase [Candidatus Fimimorpha faecalis]|uniref:Purine nucleoside phosphorylase n=1 Tax=Candidatus Fimimorpha faecalis TaxID=2840824 RepID=A0A9D1EDS4_9FIRM|nr:purine-nucleoside phosphorylase [Candidatus Fimimorpha faecalis]
MVNPTYQKLLSCYDCLKKRIKFTPKVALVLGSGLGEYAETIQIVASLNYSDIIDFPVSTVAGHKGRFVFGYIEEVPVVIMQGRIHYYEGYEIEDVVLPIRLMKLMGAEILFLTNSAGGVNPEFEAGDFMLIKDQISSFVPSPLIGENIDSLGTRFPDMSHIYDLELQQLIRKSAQKLDICLREGIYLQFTGPNYESPAEVRMARLLGADAVGMSTAVEAIAANHMGMRICGVSFISNLGCGMTDEPLTHEQVKEAADMAAPYFKKLITLVVTSIKTI